jgi:hypothetical protein
MRLSRKYLLIVASLCGLFVFAGCGGSNSTTTKSTSTATTPTSTAAAPSSTGDKIGIPECDDYIAKVEACINSKVPEAQRGVFKTSFDTARKQWKESATNPQAKAGLATGCKQALEAAKQAYSSYGCAW